MNYGLSSRSGRSVKHSVMGLRPLCRLLSFAVSSFTRFLPFFVLPPVVPSCFALRHLSLCFPPLIPSSFFNPSSRLYPLALTVLRCLLLSSLLLIFISFILFSPSLFPSLWPSSLLLTLFTMFSSFLPLFLYFLSVFHPIFLESFSFLPSVLLPILLVFCFPTCSFSLYLSSFPC